MEGFIDRARLFSTYFVDLIRYGLPETTGRVDSEVLFILDGVGGFQAVPLTVRRALRKEGSTLGTVFVAWQFGLPGEIWTDLMWLRRNRWMGLKLARRLLAFRRAHPDTTIHLLAFSGGAGVALFACERLHRRCRSGVLDTPPPASWDMSQSDMRASPVASSQGSACAEPRGLAPAGRSKRDRCLPIIETFVMACPAMSATYNLGPALHAVKRCYALVSRRDTLILGWGTRIFGTTDRRFAPAAGLVGFRRPLELSDDDARAYERLKEIRWTPAFKREGHYGGHTGPASVPFLRRHLLALLRGEPRLPVHPVEPAAPEKLPH